MKKHILAGLSTAMCLSCIALSPQAHATNHSFSSDIPGTGVFYQNTSTDNDFLASNDRVVVGTDGNIQGEVFYTASALPSITNPVGTYPDAYGTMVDISIAQNSLFFNEAGPSTATMNNYGYYYLPYAVPSSALNLGGLHGSPTITTGFVQGVTTGNFITGSANSFGMISGTTIPKLTGNAIGRLTIPSLGVYEYAYSGTSNSALNTGVGHFSETSAWGGNIALAGHNNPSTASFHTLRNAKVGMQCTYTTVYGTANYVISSVTQVSKYDVSGLAQDGANKLTLYACVEGQPNYRIKVVAHAV